MFAERKKELFLSGFRGDFTPGVSKGRFFFPFCTKLNLMALSTIVAQLKDSELHTGIPWDQTSPSRRF